MKPPDELVKIGGIGRRHLALAGALKVAIVLDLLCESRVKPRRIVAPGLAQPISGEGIGDHAPSGIAREDLLGPLLVEVPVVGYLMIVEDHVDGGISHGTGHRRQALDEPLYILDPLFVGRQALENGIFAWDHVDVDALRLLLSGTRGEGIATIVRSLCENFRDMRDGFPDLMLEKDGTVSFMQIKAEGDVIRRNQLTRLRQLGNAGIRAEIGRVDYRFDPEQDYVVVDVETTGSWASGDRITEIGAVKIRNHQVVDEWHSLLNPQRTIPARITQITNITNEMVRDAPIFSEVADSFMQFMGDGIFVAHNVNFDYGFISYEYERLERRFRFPKLCTVAGMRRRYPGHKSYGLGKLCEFYGIELETHHRALCDARATSFLLNLINQKREAGDASVLEDAA